jgi:siroheme synthase
VACIQDGATPTERVITADLASIGEVARQAGLAAPAVVVIGGVVDLHALVGAATGIRSVERTTTGPTG